MPKKPVEQLPRYELVPIERLVPYARNARTHSAAQVAQIAGSIREFGFTNPVLVDGADGIIAGHGRVLAMHSLGLVSVPCIFLEHLTDSQKQAYIIADNKLALNADWDVDLLRVELSELRGAGFDIDLLGFDAGELADIFEVKELGLTDPDDAPPVPAVVTSKLGDVWLLGGHRLACGDSTNAGDVEMVLAGDKPHLMVTDQPYGVEYDPVNARETNVAHGAVANDDRSDWREAFALFPGCIAYVWHSGLHSGVCMEALKSCRLLPRAQIVWVKQRPVMSRGAYHWQHEPGLLGVDLEKADEFGEDVQLHACAAYAVKKGQTAQWRGGRKQSTVWFIEHIKNDTGHSTQKPVECMGRPIVNNSRVGDLVYEPFCGSGTTIIACEQSGRLCRAIELMPEYVDVSVLRWQAFTGKDATLEATGQPFAAVAMERANA